MKKHHFIRTIILFLSLNIYAQTPYPKGSFRSPIDEPLVLIGNFGEIRPNHLHSGFDLKTGRKIGLPVYAIGDGFVSRIKISAEGYGKAIYITHLNGYTSVYAHLSDFEGNIESYAKKIQYGKESFEIDSTLIPFALPVKIGDLIGHSGNTGSSTGPHLHFEIRDLKTEQPINPYFFGYTISDTVKPEIKKIVVYPLDKKAIVNGKNQPVRYTPLSSGGTYLLNPADTINVSGNIGFGIETYDSESGPRNKNAVFSIEVQINGKRIYFYEMEKFSFDNSRYVNAHIDYVEKQKHKADIQKCFLPKNNQLEIYKDVVNKGIINFSNDSVYQIKYIVKDFAGNTSELTAKVQSHTSKKGKTKELPPVDEKLLNCLEDNSYEKEDIRINIPAYTMYDDFMIRYSKSPAGIHMYSELYHLMDEETAAQKAYQLSIKAVNLPETLQDKAAIISIERGKRNYAGGTYKDGWVTTSTKNFGVFVIAVDSTAPKIRPYIELGSDKPVDLKTANMIRIKATDNLSGIKKYRATIDGKWVLCEYEPKKDLLFFKFDDQVVPGIHTFSIEVSDDKNNTSSAKFKFER